ncbi:SKP1-like protein 21 [Olea europaea var. sylvestris]|uniref:SKP1-like protein 21 n=1 Tax=Olea europaea var. sylvestris TaxID=158386 RepID=UPI000C1D3992|nr:SKP1-like protein 21 [Olea europaea var. sylvestris]
MSEGSIAVVKPEMKSFSWPQTTDDSIQQVEEEVAMFCPMICQEVQQTCMGSSKNYAISLPERVNAAMLGLILDYCQFHQVPGRSNKERKTFDEKFVRLDTKKLCELTSAADSLQLRPLVDLTIRALAWMIEGKTPEEIHETFHYLLLEDEKIYSPHRLSLSDTVIICILQEEKLQPLKNVSNDPRIRLLNRLYARKRKELKDGQNPKNIEVEEEQPVDELSVDDLLSFINGGIGDSKGARTTKNKRKGRRRKEQPRNSSLNTENGDNKKESNSFSSGCINSDINVSSPSKTSMSKDMASVIFSPKLGFNEGDRDDELDPVMKEQLDREVEDFARRLNSVWPERMQELLSFGQERNVVPVTINGNGSFKRCTGLDRR